MQISSSFFSNELVKVIADGINDAVKEIIKFEMEKAQEVGVLEDVFESLTTDELIEVISLNSPVIEYTYIILFFMTYLLTENLKYAWIYL